MERRRRLVLVLLSLLLIVVPRMKGHCPTVNGYVAFLPFTSTSVMVKVAEEGGKAVRGIYAFPDPGVPTGVRNMTLFAGRPAPLPEEGKRDARFRQEGTASEPGRGVQLTACKRENLTVREKILLGIPLDPDLMGYDEWRALPGIGPVLAHRIVDDRQKNGNFGSFRGVKRVYGIGDGIYNRLRKYFEVNK